MEIKIEKGVPLPERTTWLNGTKWQMIFSSMEVGDSFLATSKQYHSAYTVAKRHNVKLSARRQKDGNYRVWRVE